MLNLEKSIKELEEFADLEGSELGEAWNSLIRINDHSYCFSERFGKMVEKEIINQAQDIEKNFEIVEEEISKPSYKRKILRQK